MSDNAALVLILMVLAAAVVGALAVVAHAVVQVMSVRADRRPQAPALPPAAATAPESLNARKVLG